MQFTVYGKPEPAGSKRGFPFKRKDGGIGVAISDANPKSRDWKNAVSSAAKDAYDGPLICGPISVKFHFYLPRPKGHFGTKGLRPSAPKHITTKPDVLKLARAVEDALTGIIWRDDSQIVDELLYKSYGEPARVEIVIDDLALAWSMDKLDRT